MEHTVEQRQMHLGIPAEQPQQRLGTLAWHTVGRQQCLATPVWTVVDWLTRLGTHTSLEMTIMAMIKCRCRQGRMLTLRVRPSMQRQTSLAWDLPWNKYLNGPHHREIMAAHNKEFSGLTSTILRELFLRDAEYAAAKRGTNCRFISEFKRVGVWKVRMVVQGF